MKLKTKSVAVYKIIFKGEITNEGNRGKIEAALAKFFKIPVEKASVLFNGKSYALKKGLTEDAAELMQKKFKAIGVVSHLIKEENVTDEITSQANITTVKKDTQQITNKTKELVCKKCGSNEIIENIPSEIEETKTELELNKQIKSRLFAAIFNDLYYAGHGQMQKAFALAVISNIHMYAWFLVIVYCAVFVMKDIPIQAKVFSWKNVLILIVFNLIINLGIAVWQGDSLLPNFGDSADEIHKF